MTFDAITNNVGFAIAASAGYKLIYGTIAGASATSSSTSFSVPLLINGTIAGSSTISTVLKAQASTSVASTGSSTSSSILNGRASYTLLSVAGTSAVSSGIRVLVPMQLNSVAGSASILSIFRASCQQSALTVGQATTSCLISFISNNIKGICIGLSTTSADSRQGKEAFCLSDGSSFADLDLHKWHTPAAYPLRTIVASSNIREMHVKRNNRVFKPVHDDRIIRVKVASRYIIIPKRTSKITSHYL